MSKMKNKFHTGSFLAGLTIGAGYMLFRSIREKKSPETTPGQRRINRGLDRTLMNARQMENIALESDRRYIIFSDHHKGARNPADDFQQCEGTYLAALDYYFNNNYTLIILGDGEELWEEGIEAVMNAYQDVFQSEARFHPGRYIRVSGNHDDAWEDEELVRKYLYPYFPGINVRSGVVFEFTTGQQTVGEIFLAHGHQGTIDADLFAFLPPMVLPYYRNIQSWTGIGRTTPAQDDCLRGAHDTQMYRWASKHGKLILIAGHTHRPVWSSMTHLEKLTWQLHSLLEIRPEERPPDFAMQVNRLTEQIENRQEKYSPCEDTIKTIPCYFNTGCCRFADGDITGIELDDGSIRLIKWAGGENNFHRTVFEDARLAEIFARL